MIKNTWLLWAYILLSVSLLSVFVGPITLEQTGLSVVVGTLIVTIGSVIVVAVPTFILAGALSGYLDMPKWIRSIIVLSSYVLAGMPSIVIGIIGFLVFCNLMGFGWSMLSAMLTLTLLLYPTLTTCFEQILRPFYKQYRPLASSLGLGGLAFLLRYTLPMKWRSLGSSLVLAWATAMGDTAAVMLTCGALMDMPESILSSVRLINYHIYLLAMEVPGGMPEARTLSLLVFLTLILVLMAPRLITHFVMKEAA